MSARYTIALQKLRFFGNHGMYAEEAMVGHEFEINLELEIKAPKKGIHSIEETVNYVEVYNRIKEVFSERRLLLETLAADMAQALKQGFPQISKISISISKLSPPILNFTGQVQVQYAKTYKD